MNIGFFFKTLKEFDAHMLPFIKNAGNREIKFYLFHISKVCAPNYSPEIKGCTLIDLSDSNNIKQVLKSYNLDYMIFNGPGQIFSVFLVDVCRELNIESVYFQHGLSLDLSSFDVKSLDQGKSLSKRIDSIKKYISYFYIIGKNLFTLKSAPKILLHIFTKLNHLMVYLFAKKRLHKLPKYGLSSSHCDLAFVYGKNDKDYLLSSMNMNPENITVSGYPFHSKSNAKKFNDEKFILYLTPAFRATGIIPITVEEERELYIDIYKAAVGSGFKLIVKAHPMEDYELIRSYLEGMDNVEIYKNENLADLTSQSSIVISDFSTALFYAIKYYKPIIILTSEYFKSYPFDYTKFGIGVKTDIGNLGETIRSFKDVNLDEDKFYKKFLVDSLGDNRDKNAYSIFYSVIEKDKKGEHN